MLRQRIITAVVLLTLIASVLIFGDYRVWVIFSTVLAVLTMSEYARLVGFSYAGEIIFITAGILLILLVYYYLPVLLGGGAFYLSLAVSLFLAAFWLILVPVILYKKLKIGGNFIAALLFGWTLFIPFWAVLINLFSADKGTGVQSLLDVSLVVLYLILLVWVADIAAYFTGKKWGKRKLAPTLSPGKSWAGFVGAVVCAMLYSALYYGFFSALIYSAGVPDHTFSVALWLSSSTFDVLGLSALMLLAIPLTGVSVLGDLLESWLKRAAGVKDSGSLLPGHGGFFDRLDSLIAVLAFYPLISLALFVFQTNYFI